MSDETGPADDKIRRPKDILQTIYKIHRLVLRAEDENELLQKACAALMEGRGYNLARVDLIKEGNGNIPPLACPGFDNSGTSLIPFVRDDAKPGKGPAVWTGRPAWIKDMIFDESGPSWGELALKYGFNSGVSLPLMRGNKVIGILSVCSDDKRLFDADEIELLRELASGLSLGLHKIRQHREIRQTEGRYSILVENCNDSVVILQDGKIKFSNPHMDKISGHAPEEYLDKPFAGFINSRFRDEVMGNYQRRQAGEKIPSRYEFELLTKDNRSIPVEANVCFIEYHGRPAELVIIKDISERRTAEIAIRKSERYFRGLFENASDAIFIVSIEGMRIEDCNPQACADLGYSREEILRLSITDIDPDAAPDRLRDFPLRLKQLSIADIDADAAPDGLRDFVRALNLGENQTMLRVCRRKDGTTFPVETKFSLLDPSRPEYLIVTVRDITERKRNRAKMLEAEEKYRNLIQNATVGIALSKCDATVLSANKAFLEITGYESEEKIRNTSAWNLYADAQDREDILSAIKDSGAIRCQELCWKRKDGTLIWVALNIITQLNASGEMHLITICEDISKRKRAEEKIREERDKLETVTSCVGLGLSAISRDFTVIWTNKVTQDKYGNIEGKPCYQIFRRRADVCPGCGVQRIYESGADEFVHETKGKDPEGHDVWMQIIDTPIKNEAGEITAVMEAIIPITQRKAMEEKVRQGYDRLQKIFKGIRQTISATIEIRDPYTAGHQVRVAELARAISLELGFSKEEAEQIYTAGLIHDIGKISIPAEILSKPGKLNEAEIALIRRHPQAGYEIIKNIEFPYPLARWVLEHHELIDGSGYPAGLKKDSISEEARIITVADVVEAMASHRPYRAARGIAAALVEIEKNREVLYDGRAVDACLRLFKEKGYNMKLSS